MLSRCAQWSQALHLSGLQEEHNKDNILPKLMASTGNYDAMFTAELAKYQPYVVSWGACLLSSALLPGPYDELGGFGCCGVTASRWALCWAVVSWATSFCQSLLCGRLL